MKLELKHLKHYIDNDVLYSIDGEDGYLKPYHLGMHLRSIERGQNFKLHLRTMSDLTKEIEINEKKFVPIVELAKLAYPDLVWEFDRTRAISEWNSERAYFFFKKNSFFACFFNNSIPNQLVLFQKLFEWHFDVFGLIDKGLALPLI